MVQKDRRRAARRPRELGRVYIRASGGFSCPPPAADLIDAAGPIGQGKRCEPESVHAPLPPTPHHAHHPGRLGLAGGWRRQRGAAGADAELRPAVGAGAARLPADLRRGCRAAGRPDGQFRGRPPQHRRRPGRDAGPAAHRPCDRERVARGGPGDARADRRAAQIGRRLPPARPGFHRRRARASGSRGCPGPHRRCRRHPGAHPRLHRRARRPATLRRRILCRVRGGAARWRRNRHRVRALLRDGPRQPVGPGQPGLRGRRAGRGRRLRHRRRRDPGCLCARQERRVHRPGGHRRLPRHGGRRRAAVLQLPRRPHPRAARRPARPGIRRLPPHGTALCRRYRHDSLQRRPRSVHARHLPAALDGRHPGRSRQPGGQAPVADGGDGEIPARHLLHEWWAGATLHGRGAESWFRRRRSRPTTCSRR